jgi:energy-coupling factor transport system ATP-binding protein
VLVLDEPTFGQDRRHATELLDLLVDLHRSGRTVMAITHDMTIVAERAQRVIALASGEVVFDGTPRALFSRPDVLRRCGLRRPPVADAVSRARRRRADIPLAISLPAVRAAFALATGR